MLLICVAILAFVLAGFAQSVTGFGSALVAAPLLALVTDVSTSVVAVTLMSFVLTGWAGWRERDHVARGVAVRLGVAGLVGMPIGLLLLVGAGDSALRYVMAATVLGALVLTAADVHLPASSRTTWLTGVTGGALLTATGMNGPPLLLGLRAQRLPPRAFRATFQVVLCTQDIAAVVGFLVVGSLSQVAFGLAALGVVAAPAGWVLGDRVFHRIPARQFRRVLVAGLVVSAALLALGR